MKKKFRNGIIIFAVIIIIGQLIIVDFADLSWSVKSGSYLGIISMILLIISMILPNKYEAKKHSK